MEEDLFDKLSEQASNGMLTKKHCDCNYCKDPGAWKPGDPYHVDEFDQRDWDQLAEFINLGAGPNTIDTHDYNSCQCDYCTRRRNDCDATDTYDWTRDPRNPLGPEVMTIESFMANVEFGAFNEDDGSGYFGTHDTFVEAEAYKVWPVIEARNLFDKVEQESFTKSTGCTHVHWFNK